VSDEPTDRGVGAELLVAEIEDLHDRAIRYARAVAEGGDSARTGFDLESAALRYATKLDEERRKSRAVDYVAIVEQAVRDARRRDDEAN
jgi:predicted DNA-binding WGR domain protein